MERVEFVDRQSVNQNRRMISVQSRSEDGNTIIADITRADEQISNKGTVINAERMNKLQDNISQQFDELQRQINSWQEIVQTGGTTIKIQNETIPNIDFVSDPQSQIHSKIDKVPSSIIGNIASFVSGGNVQDSGLIAERIEQVETLYNMSSADSSVNWGYTSGIQNSVTATLPDYLKGLTKYKKIIVYYQRQGSAQPAVIMDLTRTNVAEYQAWVPVYYGTWYSSNGRLQIVVNKEKTTIKFTYLDNTNNTISQNSNNFIFKIEGIY